MHDQWEQLRIWMDILSHEERFEEDAIPRNQIADRYEQLAIRGCSKAMVRLGKLIEDGDGIGKDIERAKQLYSDAYAEGHVEAGFRLAILHYNRRDFDTTIPLIKSCVMNGYPPAFVVLGTCFESGFGTVSQSLLDAFRCYRTAALLGNSMGRLKLALCYRDGIGVRRNIEKSRDLLRWGCDSGDKNACIELAGLSMEYDRDPENYKRYLGRAADLGSAEAKRRLKEDTGRI